MEKPKEHSLGTIGRKLTWSAIILVFFTALIAGLSFSYSILTQSLLMLSISMLIAFAIALAAMDVLARSIIYPVKKIHAATKEVEKGNFSTRVNISSKDELQELGESFNKMTEKLGKIDDEYKRIDHAKTEFLSITSHELRSPMTPMKAQLQMLLEGYFGKLTSEQKESLEMILRNTNRLDKIILDFLEISRIETARLKFNFVKTNLKDHIKKLIEEMETFFPEKQITIKTQIENLPIIEADPERVIQIFRNILNNAKKFSPAKSTILISSKIENNNILFAISDKGIGINKENLERIFEPFFQEEQTMYRKYGGTGLGLTICRGIVESQNGKVWAESEKGKGSTFYFTIPIKPLKTPKTIRASFSTFTK